MTTKKYFTHQEALEDLKETLRNNTGFFLDDLHDITFNSNYYIIGTYKSKKALEQYGVFDAIERLKEFQLEYFNNAEVETDPERMANILYYIIGTEAMELEPFNEFYNQVYNQVADDETNAFLIEKINETIATLESEGNQYER